MQISKESIEKRFTEEYTELLRAVVALPHLLPDTGEGQEAEAFYREIGSHSLRFAEEQLLPIIRKQYEVLPLHDRKFRAPKYIYSVDAEPYDVSESSFRIRLTATLTRRGTVLFRSEETQVWAIRNGRLRLVPHTQKKRRKNATAETSTKIEENSEKT